jgi:hypothetical protein
MKNLFLLFILPTFLLIGQTINFDDPGKWTEGSGPLNTYQNDHKYNDQINGYDVDFTGHLVRRKSLTTENGYPTTHNSSSYSWELKEGDTTSFIATVHATEISGFSLYIRQRDNSPNPVYIIERIPSSTDTTGGWLVIARLDSANFFGNNSDWKLFSTSRTMTAPDSIEGISIKISPWGYLGPVDGIMIDDFSFLNPLPVELTTFNASLKNNNIVLNWETATELNNYGFDIQFSNDKINWNTLDFVKGHGNSNSPKHYSYITNYKSKYYRLKQIDINGTFEYSSIVEIKINAPQEFEVAQNYPNPFNPTTTISFKLPNKENVQVVIYNSLGEVVQTLVNDNLDAGIYKYEFDASRLGSGIYFYKITAGNNIQIRKMTLLK